MTAHGWPWVWMYHSVGDSRVDPYDVTVRPERLAAQLSWLRRRGLRGVAVGELLRERAAGHDARLVGLSFDDGYRDFVEQALPILHSYGCTATVYVLAGRLGGSNAWDPDGPRKALLGAEDVRAVAAAGLEIGSHGLRHVDLRSTTTADLLAETASSREILRQLSGQPVDGFSYPYGGFDERVVSAVREAGYDHAVTAGVGTRNRRHTLPRIHLGDTDTPLRLHTRRARHHLHSHRHPTPPD